MVLEPLVSRPAQLFANVKWWIILILLVSGLVACNPWATSPPESLEILWSQSSPKPVFVINIRQQEARVSGKLGLCVMVDAGEMWEPGDWADDLFSRLIETSVILVDNERVSQSEVWDITLSGRLVEKDGEIVGSYPVSEICFSVEQFGIGTHEVSMTLLSSSSIPFEYNWVYRADAGTD